MGKTGLRRLSQTIFFLGLIYIIWSTKYPLNTSLTSSVYFNLDPFAMFITAVAERVFLAGLAYSFFTLITAFIFGRAFCGWFCPLGTIQDLLAYVSGIFGRKYEESKPVNKGVLIKYYNFTGVVILALFGVQVAWMFDPFAIIVRALSFNIFPWLDRCIDGAFIFVLQRMDSPGFVEKAYYYLKDNVLALNSPVFPHTAAVFSFFLVILILALVKRRFWCRYLCPLGAMLAVVARFSLLERSNGVCNNICGTCASKCRMNAINDDNSYKKEECILCMDCVEICPSAYSNFIFTKKRTEKAVPAAVMPAVNTPLADNNGISRSQFLVYLSGTLTFVFGGKLFAAGSRTSRLRVVRPPAALPEVEFIQRCIRCGNCMKVCPTNVLQPAVLESGLGGIWTPKFDTKIGYCEFKCNLCGKVCPTAAIKPLTTEQKMRTKMGLAEINPNICLPWAEGTECIVCEEHCPVADKAIKTVEKMGKNGKIIKYPSVDPSLCVGCAICEFKCPVNPAKAITVQPL